MKRIKMQETRNIAKELHLKAATARLGGASSLLKRVALWGTLLALTFVLGFVPARLAEHQTARQRDAAQANLRLSQLQNRLATAAINARRGAYEPARIAASDFFTDLRAEVDRRESGFNQRQRESVKPILEERDRIITLLAASDAASIERLSDLYLVYVEAVTAPARKAQ